MALSSEQRRNAAVIISVGRSLGASGRDILIAIMAALQESGLRNLNYGDRDSIGMFQQRNAWGTRGARLNPVMSARMFFLGGAAGQRGLLDFSGRHRWSLTQAAQRVQVSAYPNAYAKHEGTARSLLGMRGVSIRGGGGGGGGGFMRPVSGGGRITNPFGKPNARYISGYHTGVDFPGRVGTPVMASGNGTVIRVASGGKYGNRVEISHAGKLYTLYAHLQRSTVRVGQQVKAGQLIGYIGTTGHSSGPHLHFEFRQGANRYRNTVDPMRFLSNNSTPNAYFDMGTQIMPGDIEQQTQDELAQLAQTSEFSKPYVYLNPIEMYAEPQVPLTATDPLASFASAEPMPPTPSGQIEPPEPLGAGPMGREMI
jgi:murein DD-endopeptidase MepM/ murein hydrolase activator NlpD